MSILDRLSLLIRSEASALRGARGNELQAALAEGEAALAELRRIERTDNAAYQDALDQMQAAEDAAAAAVRAGDDGLAREHLARREDLRRRAEQARSRVETVRGQIAPLERSLDELRARIALETAPAAASPRGTAVPGSGHAPPAPPGSGPANPYDARSSTLAPAPRAAPTTSPAPAPWPAADSGFGGAAVGVPALDRADAAFSRIGEMADRIDAIEAEASLLDPLAAGADDAALRRELRAIEVARLRSAGDSEEDAALRRLRDRMRDAPRED
jgi:phage shock protein A